MAIKYVCWWFGASNSKGHGMHSPFVFDFIINVLNDDREFYAFKDIESANNVAKEFKKICRLLFRMVDYYQPKNIVNINNANLILNEYLKAANNSIELCNSKQLDDDALTLLTNKNHKIDFLICDNINSINAQVFFEKLITFVHNNSFFIFQNIHSNNETETNWQAIQNQPSVTATIDLFDVGIVLFNQDFIVKQHFKVRF